MPSLNDLVAHVVQSGLVPDAELDRAVEEISASARAPGALDDAATRLAQALIAAGALTPYQARKLMAGVTKGFFLGGCRLLRPLGEGGSSLVFLATRQDNGRSVAVKVLPPSKAAVESQTLDRFRREMDLSRRVKHPQVARTLAVGTEDDVNFMVMEYVPGQSLYHAIKSDGPLDVREAARFFTKILDGLEAIHAAGLIHRDLKPTNLMMTPDGGAKILDLGLARALGEDSLPRAGGVVVGTLDYVSPEQLDDPSAVDRRSDLYSLGCTLYFALAGRPPFEGGDLVNKIYKQRYEEPAPLDRVVPGFPVPLAAVVRKLMSKRPEERPQNARALKSDLARWANPPRSRDSEPAPSPGAGPISDLGAPDDLWAEDVPPPPLVPTLPPRLRAVSEESEGTRWPLRMIVILALIGILAVLAIVFKT